MNYENIDTRKGKKYQENFVGAAGFEPTAFWSQTRRATGLRYAPINTDSKFKGFYRRGKIFYRKKLLFQ